MAQRYVAEAKFKPMDLKIILKILKSLLVIVETLLEKKEAHGNINLSKLVKDEEEE